MVHTWHGWNEYTVFQLFTVASKIGPALQVGDSANWTKNKEIIQKETAVPTHEQILQPASRHKEEEVDTLTSQEESVATAENFTIDSVPPPPTSVSRVLDKQEEARQRAAKQQALLAD